MTHNIHHKPDHVQPQIPEGESAHYRDAHNWRKQVAFIYPQTVQPAGPNIDFANMTALVEAEARSALRYPDFDKLPQKEKKKICAEIAHSAINRPDIRETAWLETNLIEAFGIRAKLEYELSGRLLDNSSVEGLVEFFLKNYHLPPEELEKALEKEIQEIKWSVSPLKYLLHFQKELINIFTTEQTYLRNNTEFKNKTFLDDFGRPVTLTLPIASSKDRSSPHLQNARTVSSGGKVLAFTGRPDTKLKALEQAEMLIRNHQDKDGHLYYVVNSYVNVDFEETKMLRDELEVLTSLNNTQITVDGKQFTLHPILFNTQLTMKPIEPFAPIDITGKQASDKINHDNFIEFKQLVDSRLQTVENPSFIDSMMNKLKPPHSLLPEQEILLRAAICEYLNIPSVHHCASSKDRTTIGLAIAGALRKWISLYTLLGKNPFPGNDPLSLWEKDIFKQLVAQELPGCHQLTRNGLGTRGTIYGKELNDDSVGFKLGNGILPRILPARYVKEASLPKKALMSIVAAFTWVLCTLVALLRIIIFPIAIYNPKAAKESFLNIFRVHRFASLIPSKELNRQSPYIKGRHLIAKKSATEPHFLLQLEKTPDLDALIQEMGQTNPVITSKEHREALVLIANHWKRLKKLKTSKKLKELIALCENSNLTLFRLRKLHTLESVIQIRNLRSEESIPDSLQRQMEKAPLANGGIYKELGVDVAKRGHDKIVTINYHGKKTMIDMTQPAVSVIEQLKAFPPLADGETISLPIQALLCQGSFVYKPHQEALSAIAPDTFFIKNADKTLRPHAFWEVTLDLTDDNTVKTKYRGPLDIQVKGETVCLLSLESSVTLKKQSGKWVQDSYTLDGINKQFVNSDFLFTSDEIKKRTSSEVTKEYLQAGAVEQTAHLAGKLFEVLEKNPVAYKPKIIHELKYLKSLSPVAFEKLMKAEQREIITTFGRITDVKKNSMLQD